MPMLETLYTIGLNALHPLLPLAARIPGRSGYAVRARRDALDRMAEFAERRDGARPLVWFHAPSVGEALQARAVMERFRRLEPGALIAFTYFSPSAEGIAGTMPADFAGYLPWDVPRQIGEALDLLDPAVLVFSKTDVWPNLTRLARSRGVKMAMVSATLPPSSSRLSRPARALLGPAYARLDRVAAISMADAERYERLGVSADRLEVMGDAHFDRVLARADEVGDLTPSLQPLLDAARSGPTIVAGSTWAEDDDVLVPVMQSLRESATSRPATGRPPIARTRLILVPHQPTERNLESAERRLDRSGLPHRRLSRLQADWNGDDVLIVDRVGILSELYRLADVAYVGGGWGTDGLHSVLEPAAYAIPILFGPAHDNAREAGELIEAGAAFALGSERELETKLRLLLTSEERRAPAGRAARVYVESGRGAAERGARMVADLLHGARATR